MAKNTERKAIDKILIILGIVITFVLVVVGAIAWYGADFAKSMVTSQLSNQNIYFPEKDSKAFMALSAADRAEIAPYVGRQLTDGLQARAYADHYIGAHLAEMADGKSYAEVSAELAKDPDNKELAALKATMFQGETLRGMLLGNGYAFWMFGAIAQAVAIVSILGSIIMAVLVLLGFRHLAKLK